MFGAGHGSSDKSPKRRFATRILAATGSIGVLMSAAVLATTGTAPVSAQSHPSSVSIAIPLGTATRPTWWAPISSSTNCLTVTGGMGEGMNQFMPLVWLSTKDTVDLSHSIASKIAISNHDKTFTVTIGSKWKWSNGQPVTAQDVVFDAQLLEAASQPKSPLPYCFSGTGGMPTDWQSVTAPNAHTVVIALKSPANPQWFELNGLAQLVPIPQSQWDKYHGNLTKDLAWMNQVSAQPTNPVYQVVDGAYKLQSVVQNQFYKFVWNPGYALHKASIHNVIYDYEPSDASEFAALRTGQLQVGTLPNELWADRTQLKGYMIQKAPLFGFYFMSLNFSPKAPGIGGLFGQLYIRQALQYGIDQNGLDKGIFQGTATPTINPVPTNTAFYNHAQKNPYPYSIAKGQALLKAHGWTLKNGLFTKNGKPLTFTFLYETGSQLQLNEVQAIQASWLKEGIQATLKGESASSFSSIFGNPKAANQWSAAIGYWIYAPDFYPDGSFMFLPGAGFNLGDYSDPKMTRLVNATIAPGTAAQTKAAFYAYEKYAATDLPVLYVPTQQTLNVVSSQLNGWTQNYNVIASEPLLEYLAWK